VLLVIHQLIVISQLPTKEFQFTVFNPTAHVLPPTLVTGNVIFVSDIAVTCHNVLVVIVGTFVAVHLVV
jgi:hypothetical protein